MGFRPTFLGIDDTMWDDGLNPVADAILEGTAQGKYLRERAGSSTIHRSSIRLVSYEKVGSYVDRTFLDLNWAATVVNTLLVAFFVLGAGGVGLGIYAASVLKKREGSSEPK